MIIRTVTEITLIIIGFWTIYHLVDMPSDMIGEWQSIKKAQDHESRAKKITLP